MGDGRLCDYGLLPRELEGPLGRPLELDFHDFFHLALLPGDVGVEETAGAVVPEDGSGVAHPVVDFSLLDLRSGLSELERGLVLLGLLLALAEFDVAVFLVLHFLLLELLEVEQLLLDLLDAVAQEVEFDGADGVLLQAAAQVVEKSVVLVDLVLLDLVVQVPAHQVALHPLLHHPPRAGHEGQREEL